MVSLGKKEEEFIEMRSPAPERSNLPLHNFTMPWLKWGSRKLLRCMKVNDSNGDVDHHRRSSKRISIGRVRDSEFIRHGSTDRRGESFKNSPVTPPAKKSKRPDDGIEAVRQKLMFDLQTAADKMKNAFLIDGLEERKPPVTAKDNPSVNDALSPWNLRTRRGAFKDQPASCGDNGGGGGGEKSVQIDVKRPNCSPLRTDTSKSSRLLRASAVATTIAGDCEKRERAKFSVSLSRQEIADDFMAMAAHRLPRRPKKRPKYIQKQLDTLFPGLWLTEVHADFYKVPDAPETGKR